MSGIFDPAIFDSKIFDEGAAASSGAGSGAGSHRIGRRLKSRKVKGVLDIEAEQVKEVLPIVGRSPQGDEATPTRIAEHGQKPRAPIQSQSNSITPRLDGISEKLTRIEGTLRLNAEKARIAKENARVEAARVAKATEDEEDEFMLLVA